ncbi:hypothetical protein RM550_12075 [Streptomyces sp. DSM 41527]|uniref:Uncharacterized protein n=1 Tax=Streptomyces mooreae TaxID=3075523 RepID=A0ABU2T7Y6_9ACTN|nr:hypothetical protein [Streptomyces sp. DSM 41527]MDT0456464.1 hypothetical protein [Streptomyces sp. DSM 41527]
MIQQCRSTLSAARLATVAAAVGLIVLPQGGAAAPAVPRLAVGALAPGGGVGGPSEWNGTGASCEACAGVQLR